MNAEYLATLAQCISAIALCMIAGAVMSRRG